MQIPNSITLDKTKTLLTISFNDIKYQLSAQYLRVYSPSAEVRGHAPGEETLQVGKENITIKNIQSVGNYAVILVFSDGHDSGIYSWEHLYKLATEKDKLWQKYLTRMKLAGHPTNF